MSARHTPGPWRVATIPAGNSLTVCLNGSGGYDLVDMTGNDTPTNPADARLIAAAPELADALAWAVRWLTDQEAGMGEAAQAKLQTAREALAKAGVS